MKVVVKSISECVAKHHKLKQINIYDDEGNRYDLRSIINKYFYKHVPEISSRNIVRKNQKKKEKRFFPTIIPTRGKFNVPKFGYHEYIIDQSAVKGFQFEPNAKNNYKRDPNTNQGNINNTAYIEFTLNPSGNFISNNKNWTTDLMDRFERYKGKHFGPNKIKLEFFQSFQMFHIYLDLPKQIFYGPHWHAQVAHWEFKII